MSQPGYPEKPEWEEQTVDQRTASQKLWQKCRDEPYVPVGKYTKGCTGRSTRHVVSKSL